MLDFSIPITISSFTLIFLVELPDKTALATIALSTKFEGKQVVIGVWLAFVIQTIIGVLFGRLLLLLPAQPVHIAAGVGFLIFALFTFHSNEEKEMEHEKEIIENQILKHHRGWISSFLVIFAAEWGDLSQLTTAALVARTGHPLSVGVGSILALWAVSLLAVLLGAKISKILTPKTLKTISGYLFLLVGAVIIFLTLFPIPGVKI